MFNTDLTYLAKSNWRNKDKLFGIHSNDRLFHMYVIGKTGTGKTTLLNSQLLQDIKSNRGACLIDPHGDLAEKTISELSTKSKSKLVYIDAADLTQPFGYNPIRPVRPDLRPLLASGIINVFERLWKSAWGLRLEHILRYTVLTLLDQPKVTLENILTLIQDSEYRKKCIQNVQSKPVRSFWEHDFNRFPKSAFTPITNKVGSLLVYPTIRNILIEPKEQISLRRIMDNEQVLILNLSKGKLGEDVTRFIGSIFTTSLSLAAFSRADIPEQSRKPFFIYLDEFQHFTGSTIMQMLSELRKYKVGMVLAHQYLRQLGDPIRDAVLGNVGTIISFRIGPQDSAILVKEMFPEFEPIDFIRLPNYHIYLKLMINGAPSDPFSAVTVLPEDISHHLRNRSS